MRKRKKVSWTTVETPCLDVPFDESAKKTKVACKASAVGQSEPVDTSATRKKAASLHTDITSECPVCRSISECDCEEADRSFIRRVRFEDDVKKVARCNRCQAPLSVVFIRRASVPLKESYRLSEFCAMYGCSVCAGDSLASLTLRAKG